MIKENYNLKVGKEIKIRDFSEPLQSQKITSYGTRYVYPIDFSYNTEANIDLTQYRIQLIHLWRSMAKNQYVDFAVDDIVNEMISYTDEDMYPVKLDLNNTSFSEKIRKKIHEEFEYLQKILKFNKKSYSLLRDWYIDGVQYFYIEVDKRGIKDIKELDPLRLMRVNERDSKNNEDYYYVYKDIDLESVELQFDKKSIIEINSGLMDDKHNVYMSYLNKAYIPLNQLNSMEDAMLIYRIARAPERRVFYIDTGQLPKSKAETYMKEVIRNCRNKMEYDPSTGKIKESVLHMSLLDDIYLPRSAEGRGTEVSTLPGGSGMQTLEDLDYFKMKLFRALNVPFTRWTEMTSPSGLLGRSVEITRDEVKYRKFVVRLRNIYNKLFSVLLRRQLVLKNIVSESEYYDEYQNIMFEWSTDSMFAELRDLEIETERLNVLDRTSNYVGQYFSRDYILKRILRYNDEEINDLEDAIKKQKEEEQQQNDMMNGQDQQMGGDTSSIFGNQETDVADDNSDNDSSDNNSEENDNTNDNDNDEEENKVDKKEVEEIKKTEDELYDALVKKIDNQ